MSLISDTGLERLSVVGAKKKQFWKKCVVEEGKHIAKIRSKYAIQFRDQVGISISVIGGVHILSNYRDRTRTKYSVSHHIC